MTKYVNEMFKIDTKNLSYVFHVHPTGVLIHDYFGEKIDVVSPEAISLKNECQRGTSTIYDEEKNKEFSLDQALLEFSFPHKGDYKESQILFKNETYGYVFDFKYESYEIRKPEELKTLPTPSDASEELIIHLKDEKANIKVHLHYLVFEESNVIARNIVIENASKEELHVLRAYSMNLDFMNQYYETMTLSGGWISEGYLTSKEIVPGIFQINSNTGNSSNKHNPFFIIKKKSTDYDLGECFGFNLIYSGNHSEIVQCSNYDKLRVISGINPFCMDYLLKEGEVFETPFAVLSYSKMGLNGLSHNFHDFVNNHVIQKEWRRYLRPIVINNWEATYFKFNEAKLIEIAKAGKKYGAELFVLDDGWFSSRNDDSHGLGDYSINKKKLPHGLDGLAKKINKIGLKFGLWFEPECVNEESDLFKAHPDWAIVNADHKPSLGRHQYVLDLSRKEVQDYIIENVSNVLNSANIEYVKWDMNRNMSDIPSTNPGEFYHRYILGLYRIFKELTSKFRHVLFEGCASGGNRFDLGILSYFPQIWTSDNTDAFERVKIQSAIALGYPLSCISNHISGSPSHQMLRNTSIYTRFNVASFGVLGYELLFNEMSTLERKQISSLINIYKEYREVFQYGEFSQSTHILKHNSIEWRVTSKQKDKQVVMVFNRLQLPNPKDTYLYTGSLNSDKKYTVSEVSQTYNVKMFGSLINMVLPVRINSNGQLINLISHLKGIDGGHQEYEVSGSVLNSGALVLDLEWSGSGLNDKVRVMGDFGSRMYLINEVKDETR